MNNQTITDEVHYTTEEDGEIKEGYEEILDIQIDEIDTSGQNILIHSANTLLLADLTQNKIIGTKFKNTKKK